MAHTSASNGQPMTRPSSVCFVTLNNDLAGILHNASEYQLPAYQGDAPNQASMATDQLRSAAISLGFDQLLGTCAVTRSLGTGFCDLVLKWPTPGWWRSDR